MDIDETVIEKIIGYAAGCNSADEEIHFASTRKLRKLLSDDNPPIAQVIASGVVPRFVELLNSSSARVVYEAAWALTNIACGSSQQAMVVCQSGAVPVLVQLMNHESQDVKEQVVWALGNISGDNPQLRDLVLESGVMSPLLGLLESSGEATMMRDATWTLCNLCRGKPKPSFELVKPAVPVLAKLLESKADEVLKDACWAMSFISDSDNDRYDGIHELVKSGVCKRLVQLLYHESPSVQMPALRTVGNIVTCDDVQTQAALNAGLLDGLLHLLKNSQKKHILKEACWSLSNVTAGNKKQVGQVIMSGLMDRLVEMFSEQKDHDHGLKKEATWVIWAIWAISNAFAGASDSQIAVLVKKGCAATLSHKLNSHDVKIQSVCMEAIDHVMLAGRKQSSHLFVNELIRCGAVRKLKVLCDGDDWNNGQNAQTLLTLFDGYDVDVCEAEASPQPVLMLEGELGETEAGVTSPTKHTKSKSTTAEETLIPGEFE